MQKLRAILVASVSSVLFFLSGYLAIFAPLPLFNLALVRGQRFALLSASVSVLLLFALQYALYADGYSSFQLVYYISLCLLALLGSYGVRQARYRFFAMLAISLATLLFLAWAVVMQVSSHGMFYTAWRAELIEIFQVVARQQSEGAPLGFEASRLASLAPQFAGWFADLFPALFFIYTGLVMAINTGLARRMPKLRRSLVSVQSLAQFRNPDTLIWVLLGAGFAWLFNEHQLQLAWLRLLSLNLLLGVGAFYAAQGLGVWTSILYFLKVRRFFRQVLFVVLIFSLQFALPLLVGVGLADVWWDWRSKMRTALKN